MSHARIPPPWLNTAAGAALGRKLTRLRRLNAKGLTLPSSKAEQRAIAATLAPPSKPPR